MSNVSRPVLSIPHSAGLARVSQPTASESDPSGTAPVIPRRNELGGGVPDRRDGEREIDQGTHSREPNGIVATVDPQQLERPSHPTVTNYADEWLAREATRSAAGRGLAPSTLTFYRRILSYYVEPSVGSRPLSWLTVDDVEQMMDVLAAAGRSTRTIQAARNALGRLLAAAKREGLVDHVATSHASRVRRSLTNDREPSLKALEPDEIYRLLEAAAGGQWEPVLATLAFLGVRRGEALGLSWSDIDFGDAIVTIRRSLSRVQLEDGTRLLLVPTKTKSGRRFLPMPPALVSILRTWRTEQAGQRRRSGEAWGGRWADHDFVFTNKVGGPVDPDNLRRALKRLGCEAGIDRVRPHDLRHSVASILIAHGHTAPEVAQFLGHSNPSVTLTFYAHAFDRAAVRAVDTIANAITRSAGRMP